MFINFLGTVELIARIKELCRVDEASFAHHFINVKFGG
jgi:hypothetical protein